MTFGPTLMPRGVWPISAELNRPLSDLAHNSSILGQKHNVGCFSHSTFVTEPDSVFGIRKFQEFWNSLESLESPYKYAMFAHFWEMGQVFHSILGPGIRFCHRNWEIPRIPRFWNYFGIYGIYEGISQFGLFWTNGTSIPVNFTHWIWIWSQNWENCSIHQKRAKN